MNHIFSKLRNKGKLTELEIKQAMREIRVALLEADVNYNVVKDFTAKVSEKALGEDILKSLTPAQQIVKIVNDELCALMGSTHQKLAVSDKQPTIYMMCGLQGAGKTTMCGKLATYLKKQNKKSAFGCRGYIQTCGNPTTSRGCEKSKYRMFRYGTGRPRKDCKSRR